MAYLKTDSFVFNGICSEHFNLAVGWFEDSPEFKTGLTNSVEKGEINFSKNEANQYGVSYSDVITFSFAVLHKDGSDFTYEEARSINNWLQGSNVYQKLHFNDESPEFINYYAVCTDIEDIIYSGVNGKKIVFTCNSPFGYTGEIKKRLSVSSESEFSLFNSSDEGIYYPKIVIEVDKTYTDKVVIENITDKKSMTIDFKDVTANDTNKKIIIDNKKSIITDSNNTLLPFYQLGWGDNYSSVVTDTSIGSIDYIYWIRLLKDINKMKVKGNCNILFSCEYPRKVGVI